MLSEEESLAYVQSVEDLTGRSGNLHLRVARHTCFRTKHHLERKWCELSGTELRFGPSKFSQIFTSIEMTPGMAVEIEGKDRTTVAITTRQGRIYRFIAETPNEAKNWRSQLRAACRAREADRVKNYQTETICISKRAHTGLGIDLDFSAVRGYAVVSEIKDGHAVGLKPGDIILELNDRSVEGAPIPDALALFHKINVGHVNVKFARLKAGASPSSAEEPEPTVKDTEVAVVEEKQPESDKVASNPVVETESVVSTSEVSVDIARLSIPGPPTTEPPADEAGDKVKVQENSEAQAVDQIEPPKPQTGNQQSSSTAEASGSTHVLPHDDEADKTEEGDTAAPKTKATGPGTTQPPQPRKLSRQDSETVVDTEEEERKAKAARAERIRLMKEKRQRLKDEREQEVLAVLNLIDTLPED